MNVVKISLRAKPFSVNRGDPKKGDAKPVNWRHLCGRTSLLDANSNIISIQTFEKSKTISFIMSNLPLKPKQRSPPPNPHPQTHTRIHTHTECCGHFKLRYRAFMLACFSGAPAGPFVFPAFLHPPGLRWSVTRVWLGSRVSPCAVQSKRLNTERSQCLGPNQPAGTASPPAV